MGRSARIILVVVALALVFGPRAHTTTGHDGARTLTAAVLAPTTGDGDAVTPAREHDPAPTTALLAVLVAALVVAVRLVHRWPVHLATPVEGREPAVRRPPRRGPPALV